MTVGLSDHRRIVAGRAVRVCALGALIRIATGVGIGLVVSHS